MTFKDAVRLDLMPIGRAQRLDNGFLRVPITVTRVGIFVYRQDDGTEWREFRPPEEVFKPESIESLKGVPATNEHPDFGLLDSENAAEVMVGFTSDQVERKDDFLTTYMTLTEKSTIAEVEGRKKSEISAGYLVDVIPKKGTWRGERYDAIQTNIRYNHVAVVKRGRAGSEVRIHLDSKDQRSLRLDSFLTPGETKLKEDNMEKILTINGVDYKLSAEAYAAISGRFTADSQTITGLQEKLKTAEAERATAQGRADSFETEIKKLKDANADANGKTIKLDSDEFREAVAKRVSLELFAKKRLDSDITKMSDRDIMIALIKLDDEGFKAEGRKGEDLYLQARLDAMMDAAANDDDDLDDDDDDARFDNDDDDDQDDDDDDDEGGKNRSRSDSSYSRGKNAIGRKVRADAKGSRSRKEKSHDEIRAEHLRKSSEAWQKPIGMHQK